MPSRTAAFTVLIICIGCIISWIALSALSSQSYTASSSDDGGAEIDASAHISLLSLHDFDNADGGAAIRSTRKDQSARFLLELVNKYWITSNDNNDIYTWTWRVGWTVPFITTQLHA